MSGFEFLDVVRKRFPQISVIVMSGISKNDLPEELAADVYCPKNEFICEQLLHAISDLTRKSIHELLHRGDNEPVHARRNGNGHFIISCDDCLREFSVPRVFHLRRHEKWINCVHCGSRFNSTC